MEYKEFFKPDEIKRIKEIEALPRDLAIRELEKETKNYDKKFKFCIYGGAIGIIAPLIAMTAGVSYMAFNPDLFPPGQPSLISDIILGSLIVGGYVPLIGGILSLGKADDYGRKADGFRLNKRRLEDNLES